MDLLELLIPKQDYTPLSGAEDTIVCQLSNAAFEVVILKGEMFCMCLPARILETDSILNPRFRKENLSVLTGLLIRKTVLTSTKFKLLKRANYSLV